jgi:hypothetical protein
MKNIHPSKIPPLGESSTQPKERKGGPAKIGEKIRQAPVEARKTAAVVLDVLAGVRTPAEAAQELALSPACYYLLEARAMAGLLEACRPKETGRDKNPDRELITLRKEKERLQREVQRLMALQRITRRAVGVAQPAQERTPKVPGTKGRKKRKSVRALKAVKTLKGAAAEGPTGTPRADPEAVDVTPAMVRGEANGVQGRPAGAP